MKEIILRYEEKFPNAYHRVFSYYDTHNDHRVAGEALNELFNEGKIHSDIRLYLKTGVHHDLMMEEPFNETYRTKIQNASRAYKIYNPRFGFHAIGWRSVKSSFVNLELNPQRPIICQMNKIEACRLTHLHAFLFFKSSRQIEKALIIHQSFSIHYF